MQHRLLLCFVLFFISFYPFLLFAEDAAAEVPVAEQQPNPTTTPEQAPQDPAASQAQAEQVPPEGQIPQEGQVPQEAAQESVPQPTEQVQMDPGQTAPVEANTPDPAAAAAAAAADAKAKIVDEVTDLDSIESHGDVIDALKNKQFVQRAMMSEIIRHTTRLNLGSMYLNHLLGFSAIWQRTGEYVKYSSAAQGIAVGYVTEGGHGIEAGLELSVVSNVYASYKYFIVPRKYLLWGFVGVGGGMEMAGLSFAQGPPEASSYTGTTTMGFGTLGFLIPVVDVAIKAEAKVGFYGFDRLVFTTGLGIIYFM